MPDPTAEDVRELLDNEEKALAEWFAGYLTTDDQRDLILTSGSIPPLRAIAEMFEMWYEKSRSQLQDLICTPYRSISDTGKEVGEVTLIGLISVALASHSSTLPVDPLATAVLLVSRRKLDRLCRIDPLDGQAK